VGIYLTIKVAGAILAALATATGLALDITQVVGLQPKWWPLITLGVFFALVTWIVIDLYIRNKKLENTKPVIDVTPTRCYDELYLNVTNEGEKGNFTAQISIISSSSGNLNFDRGMMTVGYTALWEKTQANKSEIMKEQSDSIKIASITTANTKLGLVKSLLLHAYDIASNSSHTIPSQSWMVNIGDTIIKPEYHLQVNISSDPSLKDGAFVRNYIVNLDGIKESALQPRPGFKIKLVEASVAYTPQSKEYNQTVFTDRQD